VAARKRVKGIEPSCVAWEATVLPLNYTRIFTVAPDERELIPVGSMDEDGSRFVRGRKPKVTDGFSLEEHRAQTRRSIRREFLLAHHGLVRRRPAARSPEVYSP
jgi:hypothetical protein